MPKPPMNVLPEGNWTVSTHHSHGTSVESELPITSQYLLVGNLWFKTHLRIQKLFSWRNHPIVPNNIADADWRSQQKWSRHYLESSFSWGADFSQFPIQQIIKHTLRNTVCTVKKINQSSHRHIYKKYRYATCTVLGWEARWRWWMMDYYWLRQHSSWRLLTKSYFIEKMEIRSTLDFRFYNTFRFQTEIALHQRTHF